MIVINDGCCCCGFWGLTKFRCQWQTLETLSQVNWLLFQVAYAECIIKLIREATCCWKDIRLCEGNGLKLIKYTKMLVLLEIVDDIDLIKCTRLRLHKIARSWWDWFLYSHCQGEECRRSRLNDWTRCQCRTCSVIFWATSAMFHFGILKPKSCESYGQWSLVALKVSVVLRAIHVNHLSTVRQKKGDNSMVVYW